MEGQHIHPLHIAEAGSIAGQGSDIVQLVSEPRHQHVAQPHGDAAGGQLLRKIQRGLQGLPCHLPVLLRVPGFDIQQHQVGIRQQGIIGIAAEVAGSIDAGVQPHFLAAAEQGTCEIRLEERVSAADGHAAARIFQEDGVAADFLQHIFRGAFLTLSLEGGIGVVAVLAAQAAPSQEHNETDARSIDRAAGFYRMNKTSHGGRSHDCTAIF